MSVAPTLEELRGRVLGALQARHWRHYESDRALDLGVYTQPFMEWSEATRILGPQAKRFYGPGGAAAFLEEMERENLIFIAPSYSRRMRYIMLPKTADEIHISPGIDAHIRQYEDRLKKERANSKVRVAAMRAEEQQHLIDEDLKLMRQYDNTPVWTKD